MEVRTRAATVGPNPGGVGRPVVEDGVGVRQRQHVGVKESHQLVLGEAPQVQLVERVLPGAICMNHTGGKETNQKQRQPQKNVVCEASERGLVRMKGECGCFNRNFR